MPAEEKQPTCALVHALVLLRLVCLQLTKPRASSQLATHADDEPGLPQSLESAPAADLWRASSNEARAKDGLCVRTVQCPAHAVLCAATVAAVGSVCTVHSSLRWQSANSRRVRHGNSRPIWIRTSANRVVYGAGQTHCQHFRG